MKIITDASFPQNLAPIVHLWGEALEGIVPKTILVSASASNDAKGRVVIELEFQDVVTSASTVKSFARDDSEHQVRQLAREALQDVFQLGTKEICLEHDVVANVLRVEAFILKNHEFEPVLHINEHHRVMGRTHDHCIVADGRTAYRLSHFDGSNERWFMLVAGNWTQMTQEEAIQRLKSLGS